MMNEVTKTGAFLLGMGMVFDVAGNFGRYRLPAPSAYPLLTREFSEVGADLHQAMDALDVECQPERLQQASEEDRQLTLL
jgi:hypothetical protein